MKYGIYETIDETYIFCDQLVYRDIFVSLKYWKTFNIKRSLLRVLDSGNSFKIHSQSFTIFLQMTGWNVIELIFMALALYFPEY